ncbi:cytochrome P450 71D10-like [Prosopis cineraria]|uniref:cytochrome P450 71D10-like n=1 Tax=Prosopis cineraria TaxID=364024 RepID=UPI002410ACFB|nr:cytochrome P450 71D10-like [Prosopis cineraria]
MDSLQILSSTFCAFFFFFFLLHVLKSSFNKSPKTSLPPSGPWKLPLIGHMHHLLGSLPHQSLRDIANKHGLPVMFLKLGETSNVIISSPEATKEIMKTHDAVFANRPYLFAYEILSYNATNIAFSSSGSYWSQLRKICSSELLSAKRVQSFRFIREEEVSELVKTISENEGSEINLSNMIMSMTNAIVARAAFGERSRDQEAFLRCAKQALKLAGGFYIADFFPSMKLLQNISGMKAKLERLHVEIDRILDNIIDDHRKKKSDKVEEDLVDVFLKIQEQNNLEVPISLNNIKATILDIFIGGTETSSTTVVWAMSEIVKQPKILEMAQTEVRRVFKDKSHVDETELHQLEYLQCVIKETLRLHPPAPLLLPRKNSETCVINGYKIPMNTKILVNAWAIGRDPKYWPEPEEFKPERFLDGADYYNFRGTDFEYIPFGSGRRICPGIAFAIPNVELPLANLLYHFNWKLPKGMRKEEFDMSETFVGTVRKKLDLCLIPLSYHPN